MLPDFRLKAAATQLARVQVSVTVSITNKTKLQNEPTGWRNGSGIWGG
jgi:hypothetical protein